MHLQLSVCNEKSKIYILYTLLFVGIATIVFAPFIVNGKTLVWRADALVQHYNAFVYMGTWFRSIWDTLISEHQLVIPMWEFGIGYGEDVIVTLAYYAFGDPFTLLSAFTPEKYSEIVFCISIVLRLYFAGIAFCMYCRKMGCADFGTLCGAFAYVFCAFSLHASIRHMFFANPLIYLPFIFLGVEKILRKEKPTCFILAVFLAAISNYYFFYMQVLMTIAYVVFRYWFSKNPKWKVFFKQCVQFVGYGLLGVGMAAVVFLPVVVAFLNNSRISSFYEWDMFYDLPYYKNIWKAWITMEAPGSWSWLCMTPVRIIAVIVLFLQKEKDKWLKGLVALFTVLIFLPVAGHIFNGFGYVSNRWSFFLALLGAFVLAKYMEDLLNLSTKKKGIVAAICILYSMLCICLEIGDKKEIMINVAILLGTLLVLLLADKVTLLLNGNEKYIVQVGMFVFVIAGIFSNAYFHYVENGYTEEFYDAGTPYELLTGNDATLDLIDDEEFYRVDRNYWSYLKKVEKGQGTKNFLISSGQSSTAEFWSLLSPYLVSYLESNSAYNRATHNIGGLHSRSLLLPFASAKYFLGAGSGKEGNSAEVPFGYTYVGEAENISGNIVSLYESKYALPFGYTCNQYISMDDYEKLDVEKRQQAMLHGVILKEKDIEKVSDLESAEVMYTENELLYEINMGEDVIFDNKSFKVNKKNGKVTLDFLCPPNHELYVKFSGLDYSGNAEEAVIAAATGKQREEVTYYTEKYKHARGRTEYLINLYTSDKERKSVTITFEEAGEYSFEKLSVIAQPMEILDVTINNMTEDIMENVTFSTNKITGTIALEESKLLCFSLPYSEGWKIRVDGTEAELLNTNIMYSGVMLSEGKHTIELNYTTPYVRIGLFIGVISMVITLALEIQWRRKEKGTLEDVG